MRRRDSGETPLQVEEARSAALDPNDLWLGWEAHPPRISDEEQRGEAERLVEELLSRRRSEGSLRRFRTLPVIEILLEQGASCLPEESQRALGRAHLAQGLAALLGGEQGEVGCARALYLKGTALRLLGRWREAESAFVEAVRCLGPIRRSLDRAFHCRSFALLRWEQGRLDEAEALLERALSRFSAAQLGEEAGTTFALLGLLLSEEDRWVPALVALQNGMEMMNLSRRPWLSVRASLALAFVLAGKKKQDRALAALQEVWRLKPQVTAAREQLIARWWEGRAQARLGNEHDASGLLRSARLKFLEERRVPEAALVTLDVLWLSEAAGRPSEARSAVEELETWLGREAGADEALRALRRFERDLETAGDLRACAVEAAASIRRELRGRRFAIDPLPFA